MFHDLHESVDLLYVSTGTGPYNPIVAPIQVTEWWWLAQNEIMEMTKRGVPGVWTYDYYDGWVPNYLFWIGVTHNSIGRFYETQSYGGLAAAVRRTGCGRCGWWCAGCGSWRRRCEGCGSCGGVREVRALVRRVRVRQRRSSRRPTCRRKAAVAVAARARAGREIFRRRIRVSGIASIRIPAASAGAAARTSTCSSRRSSSR